MKLLWTLPALADLEGIRDFSILYRAEKKRILILAMIHGARDLESPGTKPWEVT